MEKALADIVSWAKNVPLKQKDSLINKIMGDNGRYFETFGVNKAQKHLKKSISNFTTYY